MIEESEWSERRGEKKNRLIEFINVKAQLPPPRRINHSVSFLLFIICSCTPLSPSSSFSIQLFFFFWNKWLNLTGHFQEGVPEQSNANTILLDYVVHGWDSKFKAALSTGVMWKILQIWVTVNRAEFSPLHRLYEFFLQRGVFLLATRPNESYLFSLTVMNFKI